MAARRGHPADAVGRIGTPALAVLRQQPRVGSGPWGVPEVQKGIAVPVSYRIKELAMSAICSALWTAFELIS